MNAKRALKYSIAVAAAVILLVPLMGIGARADSSESEKAAFVSALTYRADGAGDYTFTGGASSGTTINEDGAVEYTTSPGRYEVRTPYETDGIIYSITANWEFTGKVTLEVSPTGSSADYKPITNGAPLKVDALEAGTKIIWRATLAPDSTLTGVKIVYTDLSGVLGSFGTPALSGFVFRKPVYVTGTEAGDLFHYQLPVRVGESPAAANCDFYLAGSVRNNFADVRFTQEDQETLLPYYLESVTGEAPNRTALFWVNVPHIPEEGLLLYLYYGNRDAASMSTTNVFDLFDGFTGAALDTDEWTAELDADFSMVELSGSLLRLDAAKVTSNYELRDGIIEYKAKTGSGPIAAILRGDLVFYSSNVGEAEHCIAVGNDVKVNTETPVLLNTFYHYKITAAGEDLTFQRFDGSGTVLLAEAEYEDASSPSTPEAISLHAASQGLFVYYDWVRARKLAVPAPVIDAARTKAAQEEIPNIPEFLGTTVAPNGDLTLSGAYEGSYISSLISSSFEVRVIVPSLSLQGGGTAAIDISAKEDGLFSENCKSGVYYYASKGDFVEGDTLRIRAKLAPSSLRSALGDEAISLLSLDFRPGRISIVLPNGGEYLKVGADYDIVWDAADYEPAYTLGIAYSTNGGGSYETIAKKTKNTGRYTWTIPDLPSSETEPTYDKCVIKIHDALDEGVYDISNSHFSIGTAAAEEEEEEEEAAEEEAAPVVEEEERPTDKGGRKLYELLMKKHDTAVKEGEDDSGTYKRGDIVIIKPKGHLWGASEKRNFVIVEVYLTEREKEDFMKPETELVRSEDGKPVFETVKRRKHRLNLDDEKIKEKIAAMKNMLRTKPLIDVKDVERKR